MSYPWEEYMAAWSRDVLDYMEEGLYGFYAPQPVPNTFRLIPEPREGFIDARRTDGCIPVITNV